MNLKATHNNTDISTMFNLLMSNAVSGDCLGVPNLDFSSLSSTANQVHIAAVDETSHPVSESKPDHICEDTFLKSRELTSVLRENTDLSTELHAKKYCTKSLPQIFISDIERDAMKDSSEILSSSPSIYKKHDSNNKV